MEFKYQLSSSLHGAQSNLCLCLCSSRFSTKAPILCSRGQSISSPSSGAVSINPLILQPTPLTSNTASGAVKTISSWVVPVSSVGQADNPQEPLAYTQDAVESGNQQPPHQAFLPGPVLSQTPVASSNVYTSQNQQPSQQTHQAFTTGPTLANRFPDQVAGMSTLRPWVIRDILLLLHGPGFRTGCFVRLSL